MKFFSKFNFVSAFTDCVTSLNTGLNRNFKCSLISSDLINMQGRQSETIFCSEATLMLQQGMLLLFQLCISQYEIKFIIYFSMPIFMWAGMLLSPTGYLYEEKLLIGHLILIKKFGDYGLAFFLFINSCFLKLRPGKCQLSNTSRVSCSTGKGTDHFFNKTHTTSFVFTDQFLRCGDFRQTFDFQLDGIKLLSPRFF